jgi:hypothetical protein
MPKRGPEKPDSLLHWACSLKSTGVTLTSRERTVIRKVEQAQRNASRPPPAGFSSDEECEEAGIIYGCTDAEVTTAMETMKVLEEIKAIKTMKTPKDGDEGDEDHEGAGGPTASGSTQQALDVNDCDVNDCDVRSEREGGAMDNRLRRSDCEYDSMLAPTGSSGNDSPPNEQPAKPPTAATGASSPSAIQIWAREPDASSRMD